jgi:hypothetical protein
LALLLLLFRVVVVVDVASNEAAKSNVSAWNLRITHSGGPGNMA